MVSDYKPLSDHDLGLMRAAAHLLGSDGKKGAADAIFRLLDEVAYWKDHNSQALKLACDLTDRNQELASKPHPVWVRVAALEEAAKRLEEIGSKHDRHAYPGKLFYEMAAEIRKLGEAP